MNKKLIRRINASDNNVIHLIFIGTKPDIIKMAPLYHELQKRSELVIACHSGQHYDFSNSRGILAELKITVDINFKIRGTLNEKLGQIIQQTDLLMSSLKKTRKIIVPYVHGDTLTACGAALGSILQKIAPVHVEAGLRTMTPKSSVYQKHISAINNNKFNIADYLKDLKDIKNYEYGSFEPFPEQIDTRMIDVVSAIRLAPNEINYQNIISERGLTSGTTTIGNTISDAVYSALEKPFYDKKISRLHLSDYIFFTIHRRETCENPKRFKIVLKTLEGILYNGHKVLLIMHPMFNRGVRMCSEIEFKKIEEKYKNTFMALKPIAHHSDTVKIINNSKLVVTDSGGLQEETNILHKQCVTLRYGTDRIESIIYGNNILIPLINDVFVTKIINEIVGIDTGIAEPLYGNNVSRKIVDYVLEHVDNNNGLFKTEEQRLDLLCK
ncbi:UDP-N-acetylglucosamine 2-epimerase [Candidatus Saccharibacteria bacterium]|nr:UDP-N-acetylglucosamine 2-epimerase [Candidatus Saccharibacteria bacterium]